MTSFNRMCTTSCERSNSNYGAILHRFRYLISKTTAIFKSEPGVTQKVTESDIFPMVPYWRHIFIFIYFLFIEFINK